MAKIGRPVWEYIIHIYPKRDVSIFAPFQGVKLIFARIFARGQKSGKNFCPESNCNARSRAKIQKHFRILSARCYFRILATFFLFGFFCRGPVFSWFFKTKIYPREKFFCKFFFQKFFSKNIFPRKKFFPARFFSQHCGKRSKM